MEPRVETIAGAESAEAAFNRMRLRRIRHLVVTEGRQIAGVVSDRDIGSLGSLRQVQTVADVMSSPAVVSSPDASLRQAANLLRGRTIGCLPVVEDGKLVGIVTVTDLLGLMGRGIERPVVKSRRWILAKRGPRKRPAIRT
jgi:CBS domain-containing protein